MGERTKMLGKFCVPVQKAQLFQVWGGGSGLPVGTGHSQCWSSRLWTKPRWLAGHDSVTLSHTDQTTAEVFKSSPYTEEQILSLSEENDRDILVPRVSNEDSCVVGHLRGCKASGLK